MTDLTHLSALELGLSRERQRLSKAKSQGERELRQVWVTQREREIAGEKEFLGIDGDLPEMTDDELMNELCGS